MSFQRLQPGDRISHPTYGLGVVEGTTTFSQNGQATEFYTVRLTKDSLLTVPVDRAQVLGVRRIVNGLAAIAACLHAPVRALPDDDHERSTWLKACWHAPQPGALVEAVRDLVGRSRTCRLTPTDKRWLANACERMSVEAASVDAIDVVEARKAIQRELDALKPAAA